LQQTSRVDEIHWLFENTNLVTLHLLDLQMSENMRQERIYIKNHSNLAGEDKYDKRVRCYRKNLFKKRIAYNLIEIICNERWVVNHP